MNDYCQAPSVVTYSELWDSVMFDFVLGVEEGSCFGNGRMFLIQFQEAISRCGYKCAVYQLPDKGMLKILGSAPSALLGKDTVFFEGSLDCLISSSLELSFTCGTKIATTQISSFAEAGRISAQMQEVIAAI